MKDYTIIEMDEDGEPILYMRLNGMWGPLDYNCINCSGDAVLFGDDDLTPGYTVKAVGV